MIIRIEYSHQGKRKTFVKELTQIIIGRRKSDVHVDLDLTPDEKVSRPHARIWSENGRCWIEDLNSMRGTQVNGEEIRGKGSRPLRSGDTVRLGETTFRVGVQVDGADDGDTFVVDKQTGPLEARTPSLDATMSVFMPAQAPTDIERRLAFLYELPLQFGGEVRLDALLQLIIQRVIDAISGAKRGVLLVKDRASGELLLKAHLPVGQPAYSKTWAQRAMEQRRAFIWPPVASPEDATIAESAPVSMQGQGVESAMYAPLLWKGDSLGVLCVDNRATPQAFSAGDLRLLQAVAHQAAMAVANLQLQEDLRRENKALDNFIKLVSPQVAEALKQQRGKIRLGGEFRNATILFSDIRGFTKLSAEMAADEVADMLEDYFTRLVQIIFAHQGTIDKFVGDAILAVFGSPQEDKEQHLHAVQAAVAMQAAMAEVNAQRRTKGNYTGEFGIGIHCGEVVHGFIGSEKRMEFTVIGDAVNRASRYCDAAGKGEVLISADLYEWVFKHVEVEPTTIETKHEGRLSAYRIVRLTSKGN